ncbi:hypothetical protein PIROE2DRAFT_9248 [Piromyces sp. E2]|nr:hypothetical protein PIROE2DRAFT_9248 [Piromyces sp. E2]|eukprot:OUM64082.1 hypothetical protein PIROE2DRAFT_9248 [Piromyces sp. E2]
MQISEFEKTFTININELLRNEIGIPNYLLFQYINDNSYYLNINKNSSNIQSNYIEYYKFLLNIPLKLTDLKYEDEELYKNITWLKENDEYFGNNNIIELKPNDKNININDLNKMEYINLVMRRKLNWVDEEEQMIAIKEGFYEIIQNNIKNIMDEMDLNDITIVNFWKCVHELSDEKHKCLLLFVTGNSKLPVTGFKDLQGSNGNFYNISLLEILEKYMIYLKFPNSIKY